MTGAEVPFRTIAGTGQAFVAQDAGEGPLVVLLHGFPDTPHGWAATRDVLVDAGHRVVVPYLRGYHPDTIVAGRGYTGTELAEDVPRLLDALGAEQAVVVGHDWGAAIAFRAAGVAPGRVRAIVAVAIPHPRMIERSPALLWRARHFVTLRLPTGPALARRNDFAYLDGLYRRWAPNWSGPDREACLAKVKEAFRDPRVLDAALAYYRQVKPGPGDQIAQPGLVVGGAADLIPPDAFERSPEGFAGPCGVLVAPGAGHWPHREAAPAFHERLAAFLRGPARLNALGAPR
jgi:pimeloyl-ACP methyl ester carboxylesterase